MEIAQKMITAQLVDSTFTPTCEKALTFTPKTQMKLDLSEECKDELRCLLKKICRPAEEQVRN